MHQHLHFIEWNRALADRVAAWLLPDDQRPPFSLRDTIVVVPTAQSGRRLRRALARRAESKGSGVLTGPVVTPFRLFETASDAPAVSPLRQMAVWVDVLNAGACRQWGGLFPSLPDPIDFAWRHKTASMLIALRTQLVEGGRRIADMAEHDAVHPAERKRWRDLASVEAAVLARYRAAGEEDPVERQWLAAHQAAPPAGIRRVVLAACPELAPLLRIVLGRWAATVRIDVLVHADPAMAAHMDEWGCPRTEAWNERMVIELEHERALVQVVDTPRDQAHAMRDLLHRQPDWAASGDFAIGAPDDAVTPYLVNMLESMGCPCFDPAGVSHRQHPMYQFIQAWRDLATTRRYRALRDWLRQALVLRTLAREEQIDAAAVLAELDDAQNAFLPSTIDDVVEAIRRHPADYPHLFRTLEWLRASLDARKALEPSTLLDWLRRLHRDVVLKPGRADDDAMIEVARDLVDTFEEVERLREGRLELTPGDWIDLALEQAAGRFLYEDARPGAVEVEGWLELPWHGAPLMVVTGMNEGRVPDATPHDMFLPDSVRQAMGLRCDAARAARDRYILMALSESRRHEGLLALISGRRNDDGDVLKPSRLFWNCDDASMIRRARQFFSPAERIRPAPEKTFSITLDTRPPDDAARAMLRRPAWSVTDFRAYLKCPFRFYLGRMLGMEPVTDDKEEMDDLDFGKLVHHAVETMGRDRALWGCPDVEKLAHHLEELVGQELKRLYGRQPPLVVELQATSAAQRLRAYAVQHVQDIAAGWSPVAIEEKHELRIGDIAIRGKIDRVDRHVDGRYRVLDYKTTDQAGKTPSAMHLIAPRRQDQRRYVEVMASGGKKSTPKLRHWSDLQLPLYVRFMQEKHGTDIACEAGYVRLAKAVSDVGIVMWEGFDPALVESAVACATGVLEDVRRGVFGPPLVERERDAWDERWWPDFLEQVQPPPPEACV